MRVEPFSSASETLGVVDPYLRAHPVVTNLIATLLADMAESAEDLLAWVVWEDDDIAGIAIQTDPDRPLLVTPMSTEASKALVLSLPLDSTFVVVGAEAATASTIAGWWSERRGCGAVPEWGERIYELREIAPVAMPEGESRKAADGDLDLLVDWVQEFNREIGESTAGIPERVRTRLKAGRYLLWENNGPVSVAAHSRIVHGVARIQTVFTPPRQRGNGYATGCVLELSNMLLGQQALPILYTDLGNPTSNGIYRRLGYKAGNDSLNWPHLSTE